MSVWVILIIALATAENMAPLVIGWLRTPPGMVFLGTVHHPADYFYYLSQFAQGQYRWITSVDLYTSEVLKPSFIGWSNVLMGHLIPPIIAYHTSVLILTVILLFAAYKLFGSKVALYLFVLFHAFPIIRDGQPSYGDYWNNFATPFVRMGSVPHQLLLNIAAMILVYSVMKKRPIFIGISGFVLASLQPVLWMLILGVTGMLSIRRSLIILTSGILPILYLTKLFDTQPFLQLKLWEAAQHNYFDAKGFILATGPIFLIAIIALPAYLSSQSFQKRFFVYFAALSLALFLSPIPAMLGFAQVRFMSTLTILCLSIIAANLLQKNTKILYVTLIILTIILLPNHLTSIRLATAFTPDNAYYYLSRGDYNLLQTAARVSTPNDTFLVLWPYNVVFPALTGRKTYTGHPLLTINAKSKDETVHRFFSNNLTSHEATNILSTNHITYVIAYTWTEFPKGLYDTIATEGSLKLLKTYSK